MDAAQKAQVTAVLEQFWDETSVLVAETESVEGLIDPLDSQSAIDVVLRVEKVLGITLEEEKVIRKGGYDSKEQFVADFHKRLERFINKGGNHEHY